MCPCFCTRRGARPYSAGPVGVWGSSSTAPTERRYAHARRCCPPAAAGVLLDETYSLRGEGVSEEFGAFPAFTMLLRHIMFSS